MRLYSCLLALLVSFSVYSNPAKPIVILLSIDGFAFEYIEQYKPPNIIALSKSGVVAPLLPVYPSKTFPNHLSIITGTYPINHGIANNNFYNPYLNKKYFKGAGKHNAAWLTADPFWFIANQQGLKTAVYFWPESEVLGKTPTYNVPFNKIDSNEVRFEKIEQWLALPVDQRPQFIASYFSTVDSAGHKFGPKSQEVIKAVAEIDTLIGEFVTKVTKDIDQAVNIIIVSDHGMIQTDNKKVIRPSMIFDSPTMNLIEDKSITVASNDTQLYMYFTEPTLSIVERTKIIDQIKLNQVKNGLYNLYAKGHYPSHWHLDKDTALVPDVIIEALPPATFVKENYKSKSKTTGTHGYDPINQKSLTGIFIAAGPNIIKGKEIKSFENIHVFPFMSELLNIKQPETIDGKTSILAPYITNK
jgi:predicted AlkP superfamily pyrophosphatase or phosphodiesterase